MKTIEERFQNAVDELFDRNRVLAGEVARLGYPQIVEKHPPTAGVAWDDKNQRILFLFNKYFLDTLSDKEFNFVVCHEATHIINMHVLLFFEEAEKRKENGKTDAEILQFIHKLNVAADCVVNDSLTRLYNMPRLHSVGYINDQNGTPRKCKLIYGIDTVKQHTEDLTALEVYYMLPEGSQGQEDYSHAWKSFFESGGTKIKKGFIDAVKGLIERNLENSHLSEEEVFAVERMHDALKNSEDSYARQAGRTTQSDVVEITKFGKDAVNWEHLVRMLTETKSPQDVWNRPPRSLIGTVYPNVVLPSIENEEKAELFLAIDTSGSIDLDALRLFLNVARNTPRQFNITAITFDTKCYPYDINSGKAQGRGGTNFQIIENYIRKNLKQYPKAIVVLTDGCGTPISPKYPLRWAWLLYGSKKTRYIENMRHYDIEKLLR